MRRKQNCERWETPWKYIAVELNVYGTENADVWATNGWSSIVVEVKTSRSDYHADFKKKYHSEICRAYDIPMISYHDAILDVINNGHIKWTDISNDNIHPSHQPPIVE